jgi:hypothetical protein
MGKIGKQSQLNETEWYRVASEFCVYEMRWILKFSYKQLFNERDLNFQIWLKQALMILERYFSFHLYLGWFNSLNDNIQHYLIILKLYLLVLNDI